MLHKRNTIRSRVWPVVSLVVALLVVGTAQAESWQGGPEPQGLGRERHDRQGSPGRGERGSGDRHPHGPGFMERLRDLPPEEQERVLANNQRFRNLPPERQERIRENLRRWNALSPEEKQRIRERQQAFVRLSPEQREEARALSQRWRDVDTERRPMLRRAFRRLRDLSPGQRERFLTSPPIEKRFSPEERNLLRGLSRLLPEGGGPPEPPPEP